MKTRKASINCSADCAGFSMLELTVVVGILGALTFGASRLAQGAQDRASIDESREKLQQLKAAIVGDPSVIANGQPQITGFLADMGRFPHNVEELLSAGSNPKWSFNPFTMAWAGWRGPYVKGTSESQTGRLVFRDGWGNPSTDANFGWQYTVDSVQNCVSARTSGRDWTPTVGGGGGGGGSIGGSVGLSAGSDWLNPDADYPVAGNLVEAADAMVNLANWQIVVDMENPHSIGGGFCPLPGEPVLLRAAVFYPKDGSYNWVESLLQPGVQISNLSWVSDAAVCPASWVPEGQTRPLAFNFTGGNRLIPYGVRTIVLLQEDGAGNLVDFYNIGGGANKPAALTFLPKTQLPARTRWILQ